MFGKCPRAEPGASSLLVRSWSARENSHQPQHDSG